MCLEKSSVASVERIIMRPKYLWFLMIAYTMSIFAADWFDPRQIKIFGLCTGGGSIAFPLTYLLADVITEIYGYKNARLAIWFGLLFYAIFLFYGQFVICFLSPHASDVNTLTLFLQANNHIIFATAASYLATESVNSYLVAKLKIFFCGKYIGLRFVFSTLMAYILDELVYAPIAFYGLIMNIKDLMNHMLDSWIFMTSIELLLLPLSIRIAKRIKTIENTDIYDSKTHFNLFSLNTRYRKEDNQYGDH
jgi:queuosine precursor transporter